MGITKCRGHYDFLHPSEEEWNVTVTLPDDAPKAYLNETWALDDEPDISGLTPSEAAELIVERTESYLISTKREDHRKILEWVRENAVRLDTEWALDELRRLKERRLALSNRIRVLEETYLSND